MVFKNKLFFSSKKSGSDSSNSPRSVGSNSPIRSDKKKKPKSTSKEETLIPNPSSPGGFGCKQVQIKDGLKNKDGSSKGKLVPSEVHSIGKSNLSPSSEPKKPQRPGDAKEGPAFVSPIMASSLGLNRIKTRSGPLPQERLFNFRNDGETLPLLCTSKLSKMATDGGSGSGSASSVFGSGNKKKETGSIKLGFEENMGSARTSDRDSISPDTGPPRSVSPTLPAPGLQNVASSSGIGRSEVSSGRSGPLRNSDFCTPENSYEWENPKESESPRYQALLRMTSAPRKRFPGDIKSFSHEMNSKGVRPFPLWKPRRSKNVEVF